MDFLGFNPPTDQEYSFLRFALWLKTWQKSSAPVSGRVFFGWSEGNGQFCFCLSLQEHFDILPQKFKNNFKSFAFTRRWKLFEIIIWSQKPVAALTWSFSSQLNSKCPQFFLDFQGLRHDLISAFHPQIAWHLAPGTWYLVPGTWYLVPGTWYLVLGTWYLALGTQIAWYLAGGTCTNGSDHMDRKSPCNGNLKWEFETFFAETIWI